MSIVYLDTSCLVAIAFAEPGWQRTARAIRGHERRVSDNLLEAVLRSVFAREGVEGVETVLDGIDWLLPDGPPSIRYARLFEVGLVRGADCRHLACALWLSPDPTDLPFASLDARQREAATVLGFRLVPRSR